MVFPWIFMDLGLEAAVLRAHFAAASPASRRRGLLKRRSMPRPEGLSCLAPRKKLAKLLDSDRAALRPFSLAPQGVGTGFGADS